MMAARRAAVAHDRTRRRADSDGASFHLQHYFAGTASVSRVLRVDLRTTLPGVLKLEALPEHRVKIHAGAPVRGACGRQSFLYRRGDVDILPAGLSDVWQEEDPGTSLVLQFPASLLERAAREVGIEVSRASLQPRCQLRDPQIEHIAWALEAERAAGFPGGRLYAESLGTALAVHLLRRYCADAVPPRLASVTAHIESHLGERLSIARLAALAGLSASHFKAFFRRSTGIPVHRYVVQRRVARARRLLERGALPASQVALEAGFAHQSHMARWLRRLP
jgi:AraC family transcriptional regulator